MFIFVFIHPSGYFPIKPIAFGTPFPGSDKSFLKPVSETGIQKGDMHAHASRSIYSISLLASSTQRIR